MIIKRNIKFSLKKQKNASCRVIMRVSYNGLRLDFQTGIVIKEDFWDATKESVKCSNSGNRLDSEMNDHLTSMKVKMTDVFHHYELLGKLPNKDELRSSFNEESSVKLVQVVENNSTPSNDKRAIKFKEEQTRTVTKIGKKKDLFDCLDEFIKVNGKLNDWTKSTFEKFHAMRNHLQDFKKGLSFDSFDENGIAGNYSAPL